MKKNGFTLIEILASIVILLLIAGISIPASISLQNKKQDKAYDMVIRSIENAAKTYVEMNNRELLEDSDCVEITLNILNQNKLLKVPIENPKTKKDIDLNTLIKIENNSGEITYEYPSDGC